jgi:16S rRNA (uracil1498-N3)-methyltransferase
MSTPRFTRPDKELTLMPTSRLFAPLLLQPDTQVSLTGEQARYVGKVLRLRPGDSVTVFNGKGGEYAATIASIDKSGVVLNITEYLDIDVESPLHIHLLQCVSRGERMDFVVQKTTELGVQRITPVLSQFSVVKLVKDRAEKRQQHWQKIASSACEQCGRNSLPQIDLPVALQNWFGDNLDTPAGSSLRLMLAPGASEKLSSIELPGATAILLIGPEGGFSDAEYEQAAAAGFRNIGFGPRILRTETAAIAAVTALQSLFGDLQ